MKEEGNYISHTVKVDIQMKDLDAVKNAAAVCGAEVIGLGTHKLFSSTETGFAVRLKGWQYPIVIHSDGTVAYDDYNGAWGDVTELNNLKDWYGLTRVQMECQTLGWYTEFDSVKGELTVFHPSGGTISVQKGGKIEANGFVGDSCAEATAHLERALGQTTEEERKPEYGQVQVKAKQTA